MVCAHLSRDIGKVWISPCKHTILMAIMPVMEIEMLTLNTFTCVTQGNQTFTYQGYGAKDKVMQRLRNLELHKVYPSDDKPRNTVMEEAWNRALAA
jgi:hypothetical protein